MTAHGQWTPCDLGATQWLTPSGGTPFSQSAAQLSLELAASAYDMHTGNWKAAGWTDFSYQVDHTLLTGSAVNANENHSVLHKVSGLLSRLARHRVRRDNPISQIYGLLRQKEKSDTCKSLVMIHPLPDGTHLIAIGFMGTGKRLQDWVSNLRLENENGMHAGFVQLCQAFESHCDEILFPHTAHTLGLEQLTLRMILEECTRPDSRFRIWMAGHSQGGAVLQLFTQRLVQSGALPQHLLGYGFASPTVSYLPQQDELPLYHFVCGDDLTPRIGAKYHLGHCYVLPMADSLRKDCYRTAWQEDGFLPLLLTLNNLNDTRSALLFLIGFLRTLRHISDKDASAILSGLADKLLPEKVLDLLGDGVSRLILRFSRRMTHAYLQITGERALPAALLQQHEQRVLCWIHQYGAKSFAQLIGRALSQPHHLRNRSEGRSAYQRMVTDFFDALRPMSALPNHWPVLCLPLKAQRHAVVRPRFARLSAARLQHPH